MARVLGLDLGSYALKGALVELSLRGHQTKAYAEVLRSEAPMVETLRSLLGELFNQYHFSPDQSVVALPGSSLATHFITLPFVESKQIEAALPFELESQLPFDLDAVVFDHQIASQRDKKSDLLVAVVRKEELRVLIANLKDLNLDPRIVTHPAAAYQSLLSAAPEAFNSDPDGSAFGIVDVGHSRTVVAVCSKAQVEFARVFPGGGAELTSAVAAEFSISAGEAEQWKITQAAVGSFAKGPGAERAAEAMARGLVPVLREMRTTLKTFTAKTRRTVSRIYLCGGTAKLPGLHETVSRELAIPAELVRLSSATTPTIPAAAQLTSPQAYALALRSYAPVLRGGNLNLRRGEFAFKGDFDYLRAKVGLMAAYVGVLVVLLIASGILRNSMLSRREKEVDTELCNLTQRVLGRCERNFDRALSLLKGKESPATIIPKFSAPSLLAEAATRIPQDVPVTFDRLEIDLDRLMLQGQTDSTKQIDRIASGLKSFRCFREVKEGKVEKSKDGQHVTFRLDVQVECPEQSAGPQG